MLARTELKEIAETARVLVEISDNPKSTLGSFNSALGDQGTNNGGSNRRLNKVSSLMTSKMNLSPREPSQLKLQK